MKTQTNKHLEPFSYYTKEKLFQEICDWTIEAMSGRDEDEIYDALYEVIDSMVIYTWDCKKFVFGLQYDLFEEHHIFGKSENWSQSAYCALYDLCTEEFNIDEAYKCYLEQHSKTK